MSLQSRIESLVLRLATEFKTIYGQVGTLANLSTTDKINLVAAINELRAQIATLEGVTVIDDASSASLSTTFSASKITSLLDALKADLLGGADAAFDTLKELQTAIQNDQSGIAALLAAVNARVRFDAAQSLTDAEQTQARSNIGAMSSVAVGDPDTDFVAIFESALTAV
jgi:capsid protein